MVAIAPAAYAAEIKARLRRKHPTLPGDARFGVKGRRGDAIVTKAESGVSITGTISTDTVDLDKEVLLPGGGDISLFKANGNLFVDHNYEMEYWTGSLRNVTLVGSKWVCRSGLRAPKNSRFSDTVLELAESGKLGFSVGFRDLESGPPTEIETRRYPGAEWIIRKWMCLEVSYTAMPCNVSCRVDEVTYDDDEKSMLAARELVTKSLPNGLWGAMGIRELEKPKPKRVLVWAGR